MTIAEALRDATARLAAVSDTARLDAEWLMAHALGVSRSAMLLRQMQADVPTGFASLVQRRMAREPLAYITGQQPFYGRDFHVTRATLIPRSDSECVIDAALGAMATMGTADSAGRVLDMGTGSGALLLTILAEGGAGWTGMGIDASATALEVARANAQALGLEGRAQLEQRDWAAAGWDEGLGRFDLVIANPPYVETGAVLDPDVRDFEPASALFAGPDGLDDYRRIVPHLRTLLGEGGVAVLEIGATQDASVTQLAKAEGFTTTLCRDLAGRPRGLILR